MSDANPPTNDDLFTQAFEDIVGAVGSQRYIMAWSEETGIPQRLHLQRQTTKLGDPEFTSQLSDEEIQTLREYIVDKALRGKAQYCVRTSLNSVTEDIGSKDHVGVTVEAPEGLFNPAKTLEQSLDEVMKEAWDRFNQSLLHRAFGPRDKKQTMRSILVHCVSSAITSHVRGVQGGDRRTEFEHSVAGWGLTELGKWSKPYKALTEAAWKDGIKKGEPTEHRTAVSQVRRHPLTLADVEAEVTELSKDRDIPGFKADASRRFKLISNVIAPENIERLEKAFRKAWTDGTVDHTTWRTTFDLGTILLDREQFDALAPESSKPAHEDGLTLAAVSSDVTLDDAWPSEWDDVKADGWNVVGGTEA